MARKRKTRKGGTTTVISTRRGRAKSGTRRVSRSHSRSTPALGSAGSQSTRRKATVKTKGGLTRTAKVSKTTTGSGAGRVTKSRRVITRVKNGRVVKRVVTRVNRGGKVSVKRSKPKMSRVKRRTGGTTAPRRRKRK